MSTSSPVRRRLRWPVLAALVPTLVLSLPVAARAAWLAQGAGTAGTVARSLEPGSAPTVKGVNAASGTVSLVWAPSSISGGGPTATSYDVLRYDARTGAVMNGGTPVCSTPAATCSESGVPSVGTWQYAVTPLFHAWSGAASPVSGDVNVGPPAPVAGSVVTVNGGTAGTPDQGDTIAVSFTQRMSVSSLCSTWADDTTDQSIAGNDVVMVTLLNNGGGRGNDALTVSTTSAACAGSPHLGTFDLGGDYAASTRTCVGVGAGASTVSWTARTSTLTIRLGACGRTKSLASSTITYTPDAAATNSTGTAVTGTATSAAGRQF